MNLDEDTKTRIDNYFDQISEEELIRISVEKYGLEEVDCEMSED